MNFKETNRKVWFWFEDARHSIQLSSLSRDDRLEAVWELDRMEEEAGVL